MRYDITSGIISSGIILNYDSMYISSGGVANSTTINYGGDMYISSGGTANRTTVNSRGYMFISSGGVANSTMINDCGDMYISSGGVANSTMINDCGDMYISSGGVANSTTINYGGDMYISSGGVANSTTINDWGHMYIKSGGVANSTTVNDGYMRISSGGVANSTTVNSRGYMYIRSGGTANSTTVNSNGSMYISSGGTANNTTVKSSGRMYISTGGVANSTTISHGHMWIDSGGIANSTTVNNGGMWISSGGTANSTTVNSDGYMDIFFGGVHRGPLQIESGAVISAYPGGIIDFTVADRTSADDYLINDLSLIKGTPYTITVSANQSTGTYKLARGASSFNGSITICNPSTCFGTLTVNGTALQYNGRNYSLVQNNGNLQLIISSGSSPGPDTPPSSSGGSQVKVYSRGNLVKQGTVLNGEMLVFGRNNSMTITNGGTANNTTVNSGGYMRISSGGTANSTTVNFSGYMRIYSGGVANSTTINSGGYMFIYSGGTANSTTVNSNGSMYISSGGTANNTTVNSWGYMYIRSGGTANSTTINSGGYMCIYSGGIATEIVENGGYVYVADGAYATFASNTIEGVVLSNASMTVHKNTIANSTTINSGGRIYIYSGGVANSTTVNSDGYMHISSGGTANRTTVNSWGRMYISSGGTANRTINSGGDMRISSGGVHRGRLQIASGAVVSAYSGAIIDFTVADRSSTDGYLINDLSLIISVNGDPTYTITVSEDQAVGTYKLAQGAFALKGTISICTEDTCFGSLTVNGDVLTVDGVTYDLNNVDGDLTLSIRRSGYATSTNGIFEFTPDGGGVVYTSSGRQEIAGTLDPAKWEVVGAGDFNKSGTDGLLWLEKETGHVYVQNDLTNFNEVKNKSNCLGVLGEGYNILGTGDFTGTGIDGVIMQGPAFGDESISLNYGLPIWGREADGTTFAGWLGALVNTWQPDDALKGNTSDLADINAKNYMYEVVSVGDYNGDGVDDVMLQNIMPKTVDGVTITGSGDVFTFLTGDINAVKAGAPPTVAYAGCATDGWKIMGSGDFDGDGIDDVLLSDGAGVAGWKMVNGQRFENQWFGNLGSGEEIAGITDLNADGTDDILIRNAASDTLTGWLVKDGVITGSLAIA